MSTLSTPHLTRRRIIAGTTTLLATGGAAALLTRPTVAVSVEDFAVADESVKLGPDESIARITCTVDLQYTYTISHPLDALEFRVEVGNGQSFATLDSQTQQDVPQETDGAQTVTLSGNILDTSAFGVGQFDVGMGSTIAAPVEVRAELRLLRGDEAVKTATAADTGRIVLNREEVTASASLGGSGEFAVATTD